MNLTLKEVLTTYWPQVTAIAGFAYIIVDYFIKRNDKQRELAQSIFQTQKNQAINNFIDTYSKIELALLQVDFKGAIEGKINLKEVDEFVMPALNDFIAADYKLLMVLDDLEMENFLAVADPIFKSKDTLKKFAHMHVDERKNRNLANEYGLSLIASIESNREILRKIGYQFRSQYK